MPRDESPEGSTIFGSTVTETMGLSSGSPGLSSRRTGILKTKKATQSHSPSLTPAVSSPHEKHSEVDQPGEAQQALDSWKRAQAAQEKLREDTHGFKSTVRFGTTTFHEFFSATRSLVEHVFVCRFGMAACGVGLMTASVLALVLLAATRSPPPSLVRQCTEHSCVVAQLDLVQLLDEAVDPCRDLYGHVCRKWVEAAAPAVTDQNDIDGGTDYLRASRARFLRHVNGTLLEAAKSRATEIRVRPVAQFFSQCVNFVSFRRSLPIAEMLEAVQSEVQSATVMTDIRSVVELILTLSLTRAVHALLGAQFIIADGRTLLLLSPGKTLVQQLGDTTYTQENQKYLEFVLEQAYKLLPSTVDHRPNLEQVLSLDRAILPLLPQRHSGVRTKRDIIVLNDLCRQLRTHDWIKLLNAHVTSSKDKFSYKSQVLIGELESLVSVVRYLEGLGDILLISIYLYLHILVDALRLDFQRRLGFKNPEGLIEVCLRATQEAVAYAWSIVVRDLLEKTDMYDVTLAFELPRALEAGIADEYDATMLGQRSNEAVRRFLGRISIHSYRELPHVSQLEARKAEVSVEPIMGLTSFPAAYARLRAFTAMVYLRNPPSDSDAEADEVFLGDQVVYLKRLDLLILPGYLRGRPLLYSIQVPLEVSMGSLGFLIAHQLYRAALNLPGSPASDDLKAKNILLVRKFEECVKPFLFRLLNASQPGRVSHDTRRHASVPSLMSTKVLPTGPAQGELFFTSRGLALAYGALRSALSRRHRSASNWYPFWKEAQKTFFRRYCLMACATENFPGPVDPRLHCALPLATMNEFSWAFGCSNAVPDFGRCLVL